MRYTIFGESHGSAIGVVLEDVPSGLALDMDKIARELARRAPGKSPLSTPRREKDAPEILSGVYEGKTTGTPLCAIIRNGDQHSGDYAALKDSPRPGHADYTGRIRYSGCNDPRGGGHFSGRLTAPLVFAGAVAKQLLAQQGIYVGAHIARIADAQDAPFEALDAQLFEALAQKPFPTLDDAAGESMQQIILAAKNEQDSVGGVIECAVIGLQAGIGAPDFGENAEGVIAQHMFAVPAVKGISFGAGFACATMRGSEFNDPFCMEEGAVRTRTNHNGGINGGITNGMPVVFRVAMRPTPSISRAQETVNLAEGTAATLEIKGRHDPCVVHRAVPVIEAAAALAVCELMGV